MRSIGLNQGGKAASDHIGVSVLVGFLSADHFGYLMRFARVLSVTRNDLAIGAPGDDIAAHANSGAIELLDASAGDLVDAGSQMIRRGAPNRRCSGTSPRWARG